MTDESIIMSSGIHQPVSAARQDHAMDRLEMLVKVAEATASHVWIAVVGYRVIPPLTGMTLLDVDSMVVPPQVGCYRCEQEYTPQVADQPCPGDPQA